MAKVLVLYKTPVDTEAFDKHYAEVHAPLARKIAGLKRFEASRGPVMSAEGVSPWYLVVTLQFDSLADLQEGMGSAEGLAASADVATFAEGGADLLIFEDETL